MNGTDTQPGNRRSAKRKRANPAATVIDVISGQAMGHVGNMSSSGMLLIGPTSPRSEALYQVCLTLRAASQSGTEPVTITAGIQEQWHEPAASGQIWSGFRIVAITEEDVVQLRQWLAEG